MALLTDLLSKANFHVSIHCCHGNSGCFGSWLQTGQKDYFQTAPNKTQSTENSVEFLRQTWIFWYINLEWQISHMVHVRHACFCCTLSYFASELLPVLPSHTNKTCYPTIPHIYMIYNLSPCVLRFISLQFYWKPATWLHMYSLCIEGFNIAIRLEHKYNKLCLLNKIYS